MRRTAPWTIGLFLVSTLVLSACIPTSEHPVGRGAGPAHDPALLGIWTGPVGERQSYVHILPSTRGEDPASAGMDLLLIAHPTDEDPEEFGWMLARGYTAQVGEMRILSVKWEIEDGRSLEGQDAGYHILAYERTEAGGVRFRALNEDPIVEAIEAGALEGDVVPGRYFRTIRLTASPEALRRYFENAETELLFGEPSEPLLPLAVRAAAETQTSR